MPANDGQERQKSPKPTSNWLIAAGIGVAAAALVYLLSPTRREARRARWLDAGLRRPLPGRELSAASREWTPVTGLVASAIGGSFGLYSFRTLRARPNMDPRLAVRRYLTKSVGLRSTGR